MQHRNCKMRRSPKTKESDAVAGLHARDSQAAKADDARAQQWRGMQVIEFRRQRINKVAARGGILGVSAVDDVPGEDRRVAKILEATAAVRAAAIDAAHPRHANARTTREFRRCPIF